MKRKSTTTEHAATKDKCAKQGCAGGTDTEPAALEPDITGFHGPGKDGRVETMFAQDFGNVQLLRRSGSAAEPDVATEHMAPVSLVSTCEALPGSGDMTIKCLADVVSKLASASDESAVALCTAARTLQKGVQAQIRNLCKPWGVQLTAKNNNGKYSKRGDYVFKSELTATVIEKADCFLRSVDQLFQALSTDWPEYQLKKLVDMVVAHPP